MDIKEKFAAIKVLLGMEAPAAVPQEQAANNTANLKDGTIISWEGELAVGVAVTQTTSEGTQPILDGAIEFEDGTILEVKDSMVASITEAVAPEAGNTPMEDFKAALEPLEKQIADLQKLLSDTEQLFQKEISTLKTGLAGTVELVELMNNTPKKEEAPVNTSFTKQTDKNEQIQKLAEAFKTNFKK